MRLPTMMMRFSVVLVGVIALAVMPGVQAHADSVSWDGAFVVGEDPTQLPGGVSGTISWNVVGDILTFTAQNTTSDPQPNSGWVLSGFLFNVSGGSLTKGMVTASSLLDPDDVFPNSEGKLISGQWAAGTSKDAFGSTFDWAVGTVGDIDNGASTLGAGERFAPAVITPSPGSIDFGVISSAGIIPQGSFFKGGDQHPLVQDTVTITFSGATGLDPSNISDVTPYFGTDGAAVPVPPAAYAGFMLLCGMGIVASVRRKK